MTDLLQGQQTPVPGIDPEHVLAHLLYDKDLVPGNCAAFEEQLERLRRRNRYASQLVALQSNSRLCAWLTIDEPSLLLLNVRADPRPESDVSISTSKL